MNGMSDEVKRVVIAFGYAVRRLSELPVPNMDKTAEYLSREFLTEQESTFLQMLMVSTVDQRERESVIHRVGVTYLLEELRRLNVEFND